MNEPNHLRRIVIASIVLSLIATPIVVGLIAPHLPPGKATEPATEQVYDNGELFGIVTPIAATIVVYFAYSLFVFRRREEGPQEGVAIQGDRRVQVWWLVVTTTIVLFLAVFGTVELADAGSGGGEGPDPAFKPSGKTLPVQVIGQQWQFTYRYPTYGGIETAHLELPVEQMVELHVTSLDVIHSFWAPYLGVKADANPGVDNVAYFEPEHERTFELKCSELCGLWHGYMFDTGAVVSKSDFAKWLREQRTVYGPVMQYLPKYAPTYTPDPQLRAG